MRKEIINNAADNRFSDFTKVDLSGQTLTGNFKGSDFSGANMSECKFVDCNLTGCKFAFTQLWESKFKNCCFVGTDFRDCLGFDVISFSAWWPMKSFDYVVQLDICIDSVCWGIVYNYLEDKIDKRNSKTGTVPVFVGKIIREIQSDYRKKIDITTIFREDQWTPSKWINKKEYHEQP